MRRLSKCILNLTESILDIFSLLVSLIIEITADVCLLFFNLACKSLSKSLTNDVDETLLILGFDICTDNLIPALQLVEPPLGFFKASELGL